MKKKPNSIMIARNHLGSIVQFQLLYLLTILISPFDFFRYVVGQWFGQHIDESVDLGEGRRTQYTLLIYLSGISSSKSKKGKDINQDSMQSLGGGETVFYDQRQEIVAEVLSWS